MSDYSQPSLLSLLSALIEVRIDATKLSLLRRPWPRSAQDIGPWLAIWRAMGYMAVGTNAALVIFVSDTLPQLAISRRHMGLRL